MAIAASSTYQRIVETGKHYGPGAMTYWLASRLLEKLVRVEISELLYVEIGQLPISTQIDSEITFRFLTPSELIRFAQNPSHGLTQEFIAGAASRQDLCMAALHGDQLASYSWYARNCVEGEHHVGVAMSYPADISYMYNAFTHAKYRGRRLYGMGIEMALRALAQQGVTKLVTTINSANFASLRSCRRLGFIPLGRIWTIGTGPRRLALTPTTARAMGICFGSQAKVSLEISHG